jgi:LPXTG-site transpeptidase (sortase) family protein
MKGFARFLIALGFVFFGIGLALLWYRNYPARLAFEHYNNPTTKVRVSSEKQPVRISIPNLKLDLPIFPASIDKNTWQTTPVGVSYLINSVAPGQTGNSIMYAHNWAGLFRDLPQLKSGDTIEVTAADKTVNQFIVAYTLEVSPGDLSVLAESHDTRLTMYTCTGFLDEKRFVVVAILSEATIKKASLIAE